MINNKDADVYIDPKTDFGFKYLFGTDMNKELLIGFLNALFHDRHHVIRNVTYLKNEHLGYSERERRAIFDVYCETEAGEKFIVEMQNVFQQFFKDRSVYYSTFPIQEQAKAGSWDFELHPVYTVGILNFVFNEDKENSVYYHTEVKLMDTREHTVFFDKLTYIYIELPKFQKTVGELQTEFEKWIFVLKNLSRLLERPKELQERIFTKLFDAARIAQFNPTERQEYEESVKNYRDINNAVYTAEKQGLAKGLFKGREEGLKQGREEGLKQGREEGLERGRFLEKLENARKFKQIGVPVSDISKALGLDSEEIEKL